MPELDRDKLQTDILDLYRREHEALGNKRTLEILERGKQWDLAPILARGGVIVFPHAGVQDCGHQIAAAVHACLDSGADTVLVISVLHAFTDAMEQARQRVAAGEAPEGFEFAGIQGPGAPFKRTEHQSDHALMSFRHFWNAETRRRGITGPRLVERYPYLAGGRPGSLRGIEETARIAEEAVIVSTADHFHHGLGYGDKIAEAHFPDEGGLELAAESIGEGIRLLENQDYWGYNQHCVQAKSDARDAGQLFSYLRGPMRGRIIDLTSSDADALYNAPKPTWVAAALIEWSRVNA